MFTAIRIEQADHKAKLNFYFNKKSNNINKLSYYDHHINNNNDDDNIILDIEEDTYLVDGIGGTTWDGSLILSKLLEHVFIHSNNNGGSSSTSLNKFHIIELGCGSGLVGLVCSTLQSKVTLTDRYCDLASINVDSLKFRLNNSITMEKYDYNVDICAMNLSWENNKVDNIDSKGNNEYINSDMIDDVDSILDHRGYPDIIIGSEITCLIKQQHLLVNTIIKLCYRNLNTIILLSFDGTSTNASKYENQMIQLMQDNKFMYSIIYTGKIIWLNETITDDNDMKSDIKLKKISKAFLYNETNNYYNDLHNIYFPNSFNNTDNNKSYNNNNNNRSSSNCINNNNFNINSKNNNNRSSNTNTNNNNVGDSKHNKRYSNKDIIPNIPNEYKDNSDNQNYPPPPIIMECKENFFNSKFLNKINNNINNCNNGSNNSNNDNSKNNNNTKTETLHHIIAFYKPNAINTCKRCHKQFFKCNLFNSTASCRYHKRLYVCRKHPAELNCSIDGNGDGLGNYGNGQSDWEAKFWDCCGSDDPNMIGCASSIHVKYD